MWSDLSRVSSTRVCVVRSVYEAATILSPSSLKGKHVGSQSVYTDLSAMNMLFLISIVAKLVFKLELPKYIYGTLEVYTGADIQPKSLYRFSSDIFRHFL